MKHKKSFKILKIKLLNTLMVHGKKNTTEKILLNSTKFICKSQKYRLENLFKLAFINATPMFKLNEQIVKRGKRKIKKQNGDRTVGTWIRMKLHFARAIFSAH